MAAERALEAHDVGAEEDFDLGVFRVFEIRGRSIGVVHSVAGWFAIRNRGPHLGAPLCAGKVTGTMLPGVPDKLSWGMEGQVVRCPWHGWEFDLQTGRSLFDVSNERTATYPVEVCDGRVEVHLAAPRARPAP
jgi:nitrite reductase/ring-hydroxylating ferredoxin subunit